MMLNQVKDQSRENLARHTKQNSKSSRPRLLTALSLFFTLATLFNSSESFACATCGCTLSTDWGSQGVTTAQGFSADLSESYINQNKLIYGNSKPSAAFVQSLYAAGEEVETSTMTQTTTVAINYNSDSWGLSLQIPYLHRTHGTEGQSQNGGADFGANYSESSASGLGDVRVIGSYSGLFEDKTSGLIVGVKLATGDLGANFTAGAGAGTPLDAGLQLGTGSTDIILGAYTSGLISTYGWFVQGTVQHAVSSLATEALGVTYRPGDAYLLNAGIRSAKFGAAVSPVLQLNLVHREYDQGTAVNNDVFTGSPISGGNLAYLSPGLTVRVGSGMSVYGFVQLPIYQNVGSLQLVPSYIATIGVHQTL